MKYSHSYAISFIGGHLGNSMQVRILPAKFPNNCMMYLIIIDFLDPKNVEIDTKFVLFGYLVDEILFQC